MYIVLIFEEGKEPFVTPRTKVRNLNHIIQEMHEACMTDLFIVFTESEVFRQPRTSNHDSFVYTF